MQKFKMATKSGGNDFGEKSPIESAKALWIKNFVEITLALSVSEIKAFLHFMKKFKMAAKSGRKRNSAKTRQKTMQISLHDKSHSNLLHFRDKHVLHSNSRLPQKEVGK